MGHGRDYGRSYSGEDIIMGESEITINKSQDFLEYWNDVLKRVNEYDPEITIGNWDKATLN